MDSYSRFSSVLPVSSTALGQAIVGFENTWISQFWPPGCVQGDLAFRFEEFQSFLAQYDIGYRPVPRQRHHKNLLEPKHGVIRSIYCRLKSSSPCTNTKLLAVSAVRISNELYGSDTLSAFEIAKGFSKPIDNSFFPKITPIELVRAHDELKAKCKLTLMLRSKVTHAPVIKAGDLVQVFVKNDKEKRGKRLSPRTVLSIDKSSGIVSVPGSTGRPISAVVEDVRLAIDNDDLALHISETNDQLERIIDEEVDVLTAVDLKEPKVDISEHRSQYTPDFDTNGESLLPSSNSQPNVGDHLDIYWPIDDQYYSGIVSSITSDGKHVIDYSDGDSETLDISKENWRPSDSLNASSANFPKLVSNQSEVLKHMLEVIGCKPFLLHNAQGFPRRVIYNAYEIEENELTKYVKRVPIDEVPTDANIISSHTVYKIKLEEHDFLRLKARIAPHGNEDSFKLELESDCAMCPPPPLGFRIILTISSLNGWIIVRADVKPAFLKTGEASRDVNVRPPRESKDRRHYWLLLAAVYGLVNSNAKFQCQADDLIMELGLSAVTVVPQLFYLMENGSLVLLVAKVVDDLLITGISSKVETFLVDFNKTFEFGSVVRGPGVLKFYGMTIVQNEDFSSSIHADEKLQALECYPLSRVRRRQADSSLTEVEKSSFMSVNSSLGWLGISASPLCAFYYSHLQQMMPSLTVNSLISQFKYLRALKKFGTHISYPSRPISGTPPVSVLVFSDAGRREDNGQLSLFCGLLVGPFAQGSLFYTLHWTSHKSKRPVKSIGAAEILAASQAIDDGKLVKKAMPILLGDDIPLLIALDSIDIFTALSTQRNSIDKSICADVNVIRYEFETRHVTEMIWIPGRVNLTDPGTKTDSPLTQPLLETMATGRITIDLSGFESRRSYRPLG